MLGNVTDAGKRINVTDTVLTDAGKRFGLTATQHDFSEPQYGQDVCDRILCPMKSAIRRYCCEGNDVLRLQRTCVQRYPNVLFEAQLPAFA